MPKFCRKFAKNLQLPDVAPCLAGAHNIEVDVQTGRKGDRSGLYDPLRGDRDLRRANL